MQEIYVVTGAFGHLGVNLIKKILEKKCKIIAFDLKPNYEMFKDESLIEIVKGDICNKKDLGNVLKKLNKYKIIVIHCAAIVSIASKYNQKVYDVNVLGTKNVMDLSIKYKAHRVIHISSVHAIKELSNKDLISEVDQFNPDDVKGLYAKTKSEAAQYVLDAAKKGLNVSIIHPSGIIGPYDYNIGHTTKLIVDFLNNRLTAAINGGYDFVDVRDVADGIISCIKNGQKGECYILSNRFISVKELLDTLAEITNHKKIKTYLPLWFIRPLAGVAELYYKIMKTKPLFTSYSLYTLNSNSNFTHKKASKKLRFSTRPLKDTLQDTYYWLKKENLVK